MYTILVCDDDADIRGALRIYLTGEGLCVWFPQEALGPKNAGLPTVLLPYVCLKNLRPFAPDD